MPQLSDIPKFHQAFAHYGKVEMFASVDGVTFEFIQFKGFRTQVNVTDTEIIISIRNERTEARNGVVALNRTKTFTCKTLDEACFYIDSWFKTSVGN